MTKKDRNLFTVIIAVFISLLFTSSCSTERDPCLTPTTVYVRTGAYRVADTGTAIIDTFMVNPIVGTVDTHLVAYLAGPGINKLYNVITLKPTQDSCSWFIQPDSLYPQRRDTFTFYYQRQLKFISNACGYAYYYSLDRVKSTVHAFADSIHGIDSVVIANGNINGNGNIENLKIYLHKKS